MSGNSSVQEVAKTLWVAEYSAQQKLFHINRLDQSLRDNFSMFRSGVTNDWVPVFAGTQRDCGKMCDELRKRLERGQSNEPA